MLTIGRYVDSLVYSIPKDTYFLAFFVLCIGFAMLMGLCGYRRGIRYSIVLLLTEYVFLLYGSTVFFRPIAKHRDFELMPFWSYSEPDLFLENLMNVMIFVPIGLLLGFMVHGSRIEKGWMVALYVGFGLSAGIETLQFVMKRGFSEVDDVMHNTAGCLMGYGISSIIYTMWKRSELCVKRKLFKQ